MGCASRHNPTFHKDIGPSVHTSYIVISTSTGTRYQRVRPEIIEGCYSYTQAYAISLHTRLAGATSAYHPLSPWHVFGATKSHNAWTLGSWYEDRVHLRGVEDIQACLRVSLVFLRRRHTPCLQTEPVVLRSLRQIRIDAESARLNNVPLNQTVFLDIHRWDAICIIRQQQQQHAVQQQYHEEASCLWFQCRALMCQGFVRRQKPPPAPPHAPASFRLGSP